MVSEKAMTGRLIGNNLKIAGCARACRFIVCGFAAFIGIAAGCSPRDDAAESLGNKPRVIEPDRRSSFDFIRRIDPTKPVTEWDWKTAGHLLVQQQPPIAGTTPDNSPQVQTVALCKEWRKSLIIYPGQTVTWETTTASSGKLQFSIAGLVRPGSDPPDRMVFIVTGQSDAEPFTQQIELTLITDPSTGRWQDVSIPVDHQTCSIHWTFHLQCDPRPSVMGQWVGCLASPVFVPDSRTPSPITILMVYDSLRADALGAYGNPDGYTPTMDSLARTGWMAANAYSTSSWTLPSVQNLMAGTVLHRILNEMQPFHASKVGPIPLLQTEFARAGYYTIGISANHLVAPENGIDEGFDVFDTSASDHWIKGSTTPLHHRITDLISCHADRPLFLYIHAMDPHDPYTAEPPFNKMGNPPPADSVRELIRHRSSGNLNIEPAHSQLLPLTDTENRFLTAHYHGEIRQMDAFLLSVLSFLESRNLTERLTLMVTADHGEEFGEHGFYQHGMSLFEQSIRVPLIVYSWENNVPHVMTPTTVSTIDIPPSLCRLAGIVTPAAFEGIDMFTSVPHGINDRLIYAIVRNHEEPDVPRWRYRAVIRDGLKLTWQSHDVVTPCNLNDAPDEFGTRQYTGWDAFLADGETQPFRRLGDDLTEFLDSLAENKYQQRKLSENDTLLQKLRELGYVQ
ncbi:sulfatase [bacterium]|nr:sulfatase [candidate division CSSED10-310 bacterium]